MNSIPQFLKISTVFFVLGFIIYEISKPLPQLNIYGFYFSIFTGLLWFVALSFTIADIAENLQKPKPPFSK